MTRLVLGPFNRVEGDLEVQLEVQDGHVREARVQAPLYRGFENLLAGHDPLDALTIAPRICGICSVSQSVAAARALADAAGVQPAPNGLTATNLMLACENLADHVMHFYAFFMPDFTSADYAARPWHAQARRRFTALADASAQEGLHSRRALAARARWLQIIGTLGGKWPHTGAILPGGSSRPIEPTECLRLVARVQEMRAFLETTLFGSALEEVAALDGSQALDHWRAAAASSDLALFLDIADDLRLASSGHGPGRYLSFGAYAQAEDHAFARGVWDGELQRLMPLRSEEIREDVSSSWLAGAPHGAPLHPMDGRTEPQPDKPGAYSWNKAPRLAGHVVETGAIARQLADGQPLVRAAVARHGGSVATRVLARLVEVARILPLMEQWLARLAPGPSYHELHALPAECTGAGLSEAARGALGHWVRIAGGRIANYQIVAPTSWNFSPRDAHGVPGALEMALVGAPVEADARGRGRSVAVRHIVRSFDPCMVCTVH
jgi:uptake hydrogenase large subunit